ncbi:MAG: hypothetical protein M1294_12865 [Firmicutes bacterium]|nr:hypothetical protein [Bacillota bacterium]
MISDTENEFIPAISEFQAFHSALYHIIRYTKHAQTYPREHKPVSRGLITLPQSASFAPSRLRHHSCTKLESHVIDDIGSNL